MTTNIKFSADDIAQQGFERRFRGYDRDQVEEFLEVLGREWDHLVAELRQAWALIEEQREELREYRRREKGLHDALVMAKQAADEIKHQAERDAELKIADAELKAERILSGVENRMATLRDELYDLQQQRIRYESELRHTVESHLKMLDLMSAPDPGLSVRRQPKRDPDTVRDHAIEVDDADIESAADLDFPDEHTHPGMAATE